MRTSPLLVLFFLLAACGGPEGAGAYVIDADAMGTEIEKHVEQLLGPQLAAMTGVKQDAGNEARMAARDRLKERFQLEADLNDDETFVLRERGKAFAGGTWKIEGSTLTFSVEEENGRQREQPRTITGSYKDGQIRFRPQPAMPFDIVMHRK